MYSNDVAPKSRTLVPDCETSELVSFQKKHAALQEFIRVQAGMLQGLHAHMLMEQRAFEDTQVAWSRQQDQELAALNRTVSRVQALSSGSDATIAQDYVEDDALRIQELESALSNARIEALEAEQERALWEERARRAMDGAAVTLREERLASATRAEHLERLLSTAEARIIEFDNECARNARRADQAEARVEQLEDEMRAAKALWVDSQQRERDWEETTAFLKAQLAVAQSQVRIAKLRLLQQQRQSLVALPPAESAISASPSIGYRSTRNEVDGKENDWQPLRRPPVVSSGTFESEFVKQVVKKRSSRILPPGFHTIGKAGIESRKSLKQRNPLKDITNR